MARAAVLGRLTWQVATITRVQLESATARTVTLHVPDWPGHLPGQHLDLRLTAADGYTATRAYSVASASSGDQIEVTVELVPDGEVSTYLTGEVAPGDQVEVRGPVGGWFVWRPDQPGPTQLIGGGSGVVPLRAMLLARRQQQPDGDDMRLLYSVRDPDSLLYRADFLAASAPPLRTDLVYTRSSPAGWPRAPARIDAGLLTELTLDPSRRPTCYICGPTAFVETMADLLTAAGHDPTRIRAERFGPSGGRR